MDRIEKLRETLHMHCLHRLPAAKPDRLMLANADMSGLAQAGMGGHRHQNSQMRQPKIVCEASAPSSSIAKEAQRGMSLSMATNYGCVMKDGRAIGRGARRMMQEWETAYGGSPGG